MPPSEKAVYEIVYTDAHVVTLWRRGLQLRRGRIIMLAFRVFACLLLGGLAGLVLWLSPHQWGLASAVLAFFLLVAFSQPLDQWLVVRRWRRSLHRNSRTRLELVPDGLHSVGQHSESTSRWTAFASAHRFPDGFLLFVDRRLAYWLPHTSLVEGTIEDAARLIFAGVPDYKEE